MYVQEESENVWNKNLLEEIEAEKTKFELAKDLLVELKIEFRGEDNESAKVAKLKRLE